jgi:hypothetical protein
MDLGNNQKIRVKFGSAEFEAEGPSDLVQAQFAEFMAALKALPVPQATPAPASAPAEAPPDPSAAVSQDVLSRVFQVRENIVSLLALPKGNDTSSDALVMLLYGFERLTNAAAVTGVTLMEACRQSGVQVGRIDRAMDAQAEYVNAGGAHRGRRYSLNNPGKKRAEALIVGLI